MTVIQTSLDSGRTFYRHLTFTIAVRLRSPNVIRGTTKFAAIARTRENRSEHQTALVATIAAYRQARTPPQDLMPCEITLTRLGPGKCDDDNVASMCKYARDGIAEALGIDDGGPFVQWKYKQEKSTRRFYGLRVAIRKELKP